MRSEINSAKKFRLMVAVVSIFSVAAARAADLATTLHFNRSLSKEANPWVSVMGLDSTQLIVTNVIGVVVFVFLPLLAYVIYPPARMEHRPRTAVDYASLQLYRSKLETKRFVQAVFFGWPLPKDWRQAVRLFGFVVSWAVVFGSLQAAFAWWATNEWGLDWYREYRGLLNFRGYPVIELIPTVIILYLAGCFYFRMEFRRISTRQKAGDGDAEEAV